MVQLTYPRTHTIPACTSISGAARSRLRRATPSISACWKPTWVSAAAGSEMLRNLLKHLRHLHGWTSAFVVTGVSETREPSCACLQWGLYPNRMGPHIGTSFCRFCICSGYMKEATYKPLAPRFAARREGIRRGTGMLPVPECRAENFQLSIRH